MNKFLIIFLISSGIANPHCEIKNNGERKDIEIPNGTSLKDYRIALRYPYYMGVEGKWENPFVKLTVNPNKEYYGRTSPQGEIWVPRGAVIEITATPKHSEWLFEFKEWHEKYDDKWHEWPLPPEFVKIPAHTRLYMRHPTTLKVIMNRDREIRADFIFPCLICVSPHATFDPRHPSWLHPNAAKQLKIMKEKSRKFLLQN